MGDSNLHPSVIALGDELKMPITERFKQALADISFRERVLEPESMQETAEDYAGMDFTESNTRFVQWMSHMIPRNSLVADLGCGPGDISILLARTRPDLAVFGVDLSSAMLEIATERSRNIPGLYWRLGDITEPIFEREGIDFVFSHTTLHHLPDLGSFFSQMQTELRPGGGFCIRDLRRPTTAKEAMEWIYEATGDNLTERQYELFFHSLRASFTLAEVGQALKGTRIGGQLQISEAPKRYWVLYKPGT